MLIAVMLCDGVAYKDLGADHFSRHDKTKTIQRLLRRLSDLGCKCRNGSTRLNSKELCMMKLGIASATACISSCCFAW
jgi:hypothetical protein